MSSTSDVQPYSLPDISEVGDNDDWTDVMDRRVKKRIQNRVAQRTYRKRMKARLEELQAKVDLSEGRTRQLGSDKSTPGDKCDSIERTPNREKEYTFIHSKPINEMIPCSNETLFSHNLSEEGIPLGWGHLSRQLQDKDDNQQGTINLPQLESSKILSPQEMASISQSNKRHHPLTPTTSENLESLDFLLNGHVDAQKSDSFAQEIRQIPLSAMSLSSETTLNAPSSVNNDAVIIDHTTDDKMESPALSSNKPSLDQRFECIMECVGAARFSSFDALVTAYYNESFQESSRLSNEQRLSRHRRLPGVLADIFRAANHWSAWERRGINEEILKATEDVLISENNSAWSSMNNGIAPVLKAQDSGDPMSIKQAIPVFKMIVPDHLPSLWTLMMALAASDRPAWQRDCSSTALAAILLLHFAGRMDNEKLIELISACL